MDETPWGFAFGIFFSVMMFSIGLWMAIAPRSYLRSQTKGPLPSVWVLLTGTTDPESRSAQFIWRLIGIGIVAVVAFYDYAVFGVAHSR
jgi:hypothetical protein